MDKEFVVGAVAIVDALGFKGIWKREPAGSVLSKLRQVFELSKLQPRPTDSFPLSITFLSDTIVIGAQINPQRADAPGGSVFEQMAALSQVCDFTQLMLHELLMNGDPPLAYRGAIAFGDFVVDDPFIIGPAVDEAAEAEKLAEGAFVWLTDSALRVYDAALASQRAGRPHYLLGDVIGIPARRYQIPIKNAATCSTLALVPPPEAAEVEVTERYTQAFRSDREDVMVKYQNTMRFLRQHWSDVGRRIRGDA